MHSIIFVVSFINLNENGREEIQRIKAGNPDITHREAFSAAAKNVSLSLSLSLFPSF